MIDYISNIKWKKWIAYLVLVVLIILFPVLVNDSYIIHLVIMALTWGVVVTNWNLTLGYGGMFHIAQPTFFGIGLYAAAVSAVSLGLSPWLCMLIGGIVSFMASLVIGIPALRVKGMYLILLTFAFHFTISELVFQFSKYTGGSMGLTVPTFTLGSIIFSPLHLAPYYYVAIIILILSILVTWVIMRKPIGKSLIAIRDSEVLAPCIGISIFRSKITTFAISAFITGIAGGFYAHYTMVVSPEQFSFNLIVNAFAMIIIGGVGTLFGPVIGSFIITFLTELFRSFETYRPIIVGLIIILMLIFAPNGFVQGIKTLFNWAREILVQKKIYNN